MKQFLLSLSLLFTAHSMLAQESLTINVNTAGTLESLVEAASPEYLSQVKQLTVTGQLNGDDLAVLLYVIGKIGNVSEEIKEKAKAKLTKWFDEDEMEEINELKM